MDDPFGFRHKALIDLLNLLHNRLTTIEIKIDKILAGEEE